MSSMQEEEQFHPLIKQAFSNEKLTGYDIACNSEMAEIIKRDSTEFAMGVIKHKRGKEIVCELVDVALRPRILVSYLEKKRQQQQQSKPSNQNGQQLHCSTSVLTANLNQSSKQITTIVYNAIQILTNQYEQFVQFIFDENNKSEFIKSGEICESSMNSIKDVYDIKKLRGSIEKNIDNDDDFADVIIGNDNNDGGQSEKNGEEVENPCCSSQEDHQQQGWQDCVIMDSGYPELTRNQQDELLQKIISTTKIAHNETYKSPFLDRMFLLFQQPIPIEQTPVSYFNKIMLQFVYQKPQQIMRYFYCDEKGKNTKSKSSINDSKKSDNNKAKRLNKKNGNILNTSLTSSNNLKIPRVRMISRHLYNNSVIQLLVHLMQLQSDGNFFSPQKIDILKAITQQVFPSQPVAKSNLKKSQLQAQLIMQTSTMGDLTEDRISNFVLFMKQMYEKLEDRYEQEKFLSVFKYYVNDTNVIKRIADYFKSQQHDLNANGFVSLLTQVLKFDKVNFIKHKSQMPSASPFGGGDHFGFSNNSTSQKEDSSITSYDLNLSSQILTEIQKIILVLIQKYKQQQASTIRMIEYYDLLYNFLNITISSRQNIIKSNILTPAFINDCLFKFQEHQRASILHNSIKNILVDFLPKLDHAVNVILAPQCELVAFIQNYLHVNSNESSHNGKKGKRNMKCFENQLFHIGKAVISIWEQQKMLNAIKKTQDNEQDCLQKIHLDYPQSLAFDGQILIKISKLKEIITKKQEFYSHLICGDPRKMGDYHQDESSQIIMTSSSLKNYFKPNLLYSGENENDNEVMNIKVSQKHSNDRYTDNIEDEDEQEEFSKKEGLNRKLDIEDLKRQTNLKTDPKYKSLRIGDDHSSSLFESAISPMNAYRSHTFNFETDALPLDSDNSENMSEEEDFPLKKQEGNDDEIKLMQQNIENFDIASDNFVLGMESNILSSNNSISNERSNLLLSGDNYRRDELSKSVDIPDLGMDTIEKVESYMAIESPRKQSEDEMLSLGIDSKNSESKISEEQLQSRLEVVTSDIVPSFMKDEQKSELQNEKMQDETSGSQMSEFVRPYYSYLKYKIEDLCMELE